MLILPDRRKCQHTEMKLTSRHNRKLMDIIVRLCLVFYCAGVSMDREGYVLLDEILQLQQFKGVSVDDIMQGPYVYTNVVFYFLMIWRLCAD